MSVCVLCWACVWLTHPAHTSSFRHVGEVINTFMDALDDGSEWDVLTHTLTKQQVEGVVQQLLL